MVALRSVAAVFARSDKMHSQSLASLSLASPFFKTWTFSAFGKMLIDFGPSPFGGSVEENVEDNHFTLFVNWCSKFLRSLVT